MLRQIVLDTETTGLEPTKGHKLTEIGCLELINRKLTGRRFHSYINPERELDPGAAQITGLTLEFLQDKPKFHEIVDDFIEFLCGSDNEGCELIIHNAPFDLGFLNHELKLIKHDYMGLEDRWSIVDTLNMARKLHPGQKNNLDALSKRYNVDISHREYHGALLDAGILSNVYLAMTAGQKSFAMGNEVETNSIEIKKSRAKKLLRQADKTLVIIRASEEEYLAHEAY